MDISYLKGKVIGFILRPDLILKQNRVSFCIPIEEPYENNYVLSYNQTEDSLGFIDNICGDTRDLLNLEILETEEISKNSLTHDVNMWKISSILKNLILENKDLTRLNHTSYTLTTIAGSVIFNFFVLSKKETSPSCKNITFFKEQT